MFIITLKTFNLEFIHRFSGLDSTSAVSLLQLLHQLARVDCGGGHDGGPKTVITSIHQPSSAVFRSFDNVLMLSDGHVVYFGSPVASLDYFGTTI